MFPPAYLRWVTHGFPLPALWAHGCRAGASTDWLSCFYGPRSLTRGAIHYHRIRLALLGRVAVAPRRICGLRAHAARATGTFGFMARPQDLLTTPIFSAGQSRPTAHICTVRTSPIVPVWLAAPYATTSAARCSFSPIPRHRSSPLFPIPDPIPTYATSTRTRTYTAGRSQLRTWRKDTRVAAGAHL